MNINGVEFTIGADPEVFAGNSNGAFVSAHDLIPGTKREPFIVDKGAVQVDGLALEFNIDPASSHDEFLNNLATVKSVLSEMIGDKQFIEDVSVRFDEEFLKGIPAENLLLGCSPDYNGWTGYENPKPSEKALMRTVGGHVHIGGFPTQEPHEATHYQTCGRLARILDETLGVYSILWDKDDERRSMYGLAGTFRPTKYGMEYRTLSNKWIFDTKITSFVYSAVEEAIRKMFDPHYEPDPEVRRIIDESDRASSFFLNNSKAEMLV